jgi:hypothetical protein
MDKKLSGLIFVFLLSASLFVSYVVFNQPLSRLIRAKEEFIPSKEKSLIFAWPLNSSIGKPVTINVFLRNENGLPLVNKNITLSTTLGQITPQQASTDKSGKATFILTSSSPGIAEVSANAENTYILNQKVTIKFE